MDANERAKLVAVVAKVVAAANELRETPNYFQSADVRVTMRFDFDGRDAIWFDAAVGDLTVCDAGGALEALEALAAACARPKNRRGVR